MLQAVTMKPLNAGSPVKEQVAARVDPEVFDAIKKVKAADPTKPTLSETVAALLREALVARGAVSK